MVMNDQPFYLVDANLLVLLVVGLTSRALVSRHKKTRTFGVSDFDRLRGILRDKPILILPNIATETSNLLCFHPEPERAKLLATFHSLLDHVTEHFIASRGAAARSEYNYLGLTDAAILEASTNTRLLTADALLYATALRQGVKAINFNHLR